MIGSMLQAHEVRTLYERAFAASNQRLEIVTGDPVASLLRQDTRGDLGSVPVGGCAAGVSGLTFLPDGTITPCRRLPVPIGNVLKDSLREVWAASPVLNTLRDKVAYSGKCGACLRWASCRGCRAIAYASGGGDSRNALVTEDPQCFIDAPARLNSSSE